MSDRARALLEACTAARDGGADFPTIWREILMAHPLVGGFPVQRTHAGEPVLEVPLVTGQRLVCAAAGFSLA
jgi:hypothetical protein